MRPDFPSARRALVSCLFAVLASATLAAAAAAAEVSGSHWVGSDALLYFEARHPAALVDRILGDSLQKALLGIPPYADFVESEGARKARQILEMIAGKLDTTWEDGLRRLVRGGMVFAVQAGAGAGPQTVLVATPDDPAFLKRTNEAILELARQDAADNGRGEPVRTSEYRGVTLHEPDKGAYAIVQGSFVIADSGTTLKTVVDRALDGAKAGASLADNDDWKAQRAAASPDAMAWGFARLELFRMIDPDKFSFSAEGKPQRTLLFASWLEALRKANWISAELNWEEGSLALGVTVPTPSGGYSPALKGFTPPRGQGAEAVLAPPGTIGTISLWRDLANVWDARAELFSPDVVQGLAHLDNVAGQFFAARDFGQGVLGGLGTHSRLVIANQDFQAIKPVPDLKLPAFALVTDLKPDDQDFAQRLRGAFQAFVGHANENAAQSNTPSLELRSERFDGVTITTAHFMPLAGSADEDAKKQDAVHQRHNFSPSVAQVDNRFIISSSLGLTRALIKSLRTPAKAGDGTLVVEADGTELARCLDLNMTRLVAQNMAEKGHDQAQAKREIGIVLHLLRFLGHGRLTVHDGAKAVRARLHFALGQ